MKEYSVHQPQQSYPSCHHKDDCRRVHPAVLLQAIRACPVSRPCPRPHVSRIGSTPYSVLRPAIFVRQGHPDHRAPGMKGREETRWRVFRLGEAEEVRGVAAELAPTTGLSSAERLQGACGEKRVTPREHLGSVIKNSRPVETKKPSSRLTYYKTVRVSNTALAVLHTSPKLSSLLQS